MGVLSLGFGCLRCLRRVDPDNGRDLRRFGALADKSLGCAKERRIEGCVAGGIEGVGLPEVDLIRCHQADASVVMVLVIPGEEASAECACFVDGLEPFGEFRLIFQRLEVGFRERVVIRGVRPAQGI